MSRIKVYDSGGFTQRYMASPELGPLLKGDFREFFIVRVEEMYRLVKAAVPATRSTGHTLIYITAGEARMKIGSGQYSTGKDELLLVPAGQVFSFEEGDVNKGYLCHFNEALLTGLFRKKEQDALSPWTRLHHLRPDIRTSSFILQLFERLLIEYSAYGLQRKDLVQAYLFTLLTELNQLCQPPVSGKVTPDTLADCFREKLLSNFRTHHLVKEYADMLHVSPNHLNKSIKSVTGRTPTRWIDDALVLEAKILLRQTHIPIGELAAELGFTDPSYFTRLFRKYEGVTPTRWRQMIEKS